MVEPCCLSVVGLLEVVNDHKCFGALFADQPDCLHPFGEALAVVYEDQVGPETRREAGEEMHPRVVCRDLLGPRLVRLDRPELFETWEAQEERG